ncbi:MAG TPA: type IX secretion system outer membrane channel protein PorV [Ignavibacteria bacterium]|nr:type IX secretion system outer membrane channel protein PorV [Ignavibacteria bacterium]HMR40125.1 type IX secretion system outer membrane channel protein PorV [Ignavibacteria bacterium]
MFNKSFAYFCVSLVLLTLFSSSKNDVYSQSTVSTGVPFLLIGPNSRFGSMGETGTAIADDATAMFWNPAGLANQQKYTEINFTHSPWLSGLNIGDLFYDYIAGRSYIKSIDGTIGASLTYLNIGEVIVTDEFGNAQPDRNYKAYEMAFSVGYATELGKGWSGGVTGTFIYSRLSPNDFTVGNEKGTGTGISAAFGLSTIYKPLKGKNTFQKRFSFGAMLANMGPNISYVDADQADPLPFQLRTGVAYDVVQSQFNTLTLTVDFAKLLVNRTLATPDVVDSNGVIIEPGTPGSVDPFYEAMFTSWGGGLNAIQTSIGAEYWYGSPRLIALRGGYFYEDPAYGNRNFFTLGAGIRYDLYGFDFAYISTIEESHPLANTLRFGLLVSF